MKLDFYLSEMSVSDLHGGGLTLQRILGRDLFDIEHFAHVSRFATDLPIIPELQGQEINLAPFWDGDRARAILGNTLANSISKKSLVAKKAAKKAADILYGKFEKGTVLKGLVCPQSAASLYTLEELKKKCTVKYISWVMDDHLIRYTDGKWAYQNGLEELFGKHLREAETVFVISDAMREFYRERFNIESEVLFSPFDLPATLHQPVVSSAKQALKIGYFGAVASWQMDALHLVAQTIGHTQHQLHIYSGIEQLPSSLQCENVFLMERVLPSKVLDTMRNYNTVLLPMSFLNQMRNMSSFNIATKMSEYLASGVPILAVGPADAAMIKYLESNAAAVVVNSNTPHAVNNVLSIFADKKRIAAILNNARNLVINETGVQPMRQKWLDGLKKVAS